jgi:hypothetical protein
MATVAIALSEMRRTVSFQAMTMRTRLFFIGRLRESAAHRELEGNSLERRFAELLL